MATTKQSMEEDGKSFGDSFNEETAAPVEQTEDEAFGLNLPAADDAAAEGDGETDGSAVEVESGSEAIPEELPAEPPADEVAAAEAQAEAGQDDMPEMTQSEKSWEGRLRAREVELKALAEHLDQRKNRPGPEEIGAHEGYEVPADAADLSAAQEEAAESPAEESAEGADGEAEEAMRQLSEDFGPEFVKMICAIAMKKAHEAAGQRCDELGGTVKEVIADIENSRARRHFEEIYDAFPDFAEINESEPFNAFVDSMPADAQADVERVRASGSAKEIIRLLSTFKSQAQSGGDDEGLDAAEGVRSTGIRLPSQPAAGADDFAAAWDEQT